MKKTKVYILIYLSMMLPILLSAAPIDKYYIPPIQRQVPQQKMPSPKEKTNVSDVYDDFRKKAGKLSDTEKINLKSFFEKKMKAAGENQNFDAARYYQELIKILNEV